MIASDTASSLSHGMYPSIYKISHKYAHKMLKNSARRGMTDTRTIQKKVHKKSEQCSGRHTLWEDSLVLIFIGSAGFALAFSSLYEKKCCDLMMFLRSRGGLSAKRAASMVWFSGMTLWSNSLMWLEPILLFKELRANVFQHITWN